MFGFGKKNRTPRISTVIGQGAEVAGNVHFKGGLHVDGHIKGNVVAEGEAGFLSISADGSVEGEVRVPNIVLDGTVKGDVYASNHIDLAAQARVQGNVYYRFLEMASGAEVNGKLVRHQDQEPPRLGYETAKDVHEGEVLEPEAPNHS